MANNKYLGMEKYIFTDLYNFFLKFKDMPDTKEYWEICITDANLINFKYKNHPFVKKMLLAIMEQLENKISNKKCDGKTYKEWESILGISNKSD